MKKKKQDLATIELTKRNKEIVSKVIKAVEKSVGTTFKISTANVINSALDLISLEDDGWNLVRRSIEARIENRINKRIAKTPKYFVYKNKIGGSQND